MLILFLNEDVLIVYDYLITIIYSGLIFVGNIATKDNVRERIPSEKCI